MEFQKYSSIENSYRQKNLDEIFMRGLADGDWVVTEKVHGSNFSFWMNHEGLRCAKRGGFLALGQKFYNWELVAEAYDKHLSILYQICCGMLKDLEEQGVIAIENDDIEVVLFGEIFGGYYDHPDVEKDPKACRIQKGVSYCPWNDFYAFDLKINGAFISYDLFAEIMEMVGFHYAKSLYRGDLKTCLKFPNDLPTALPKKFNLPEIKNNVSEGVVIKPVLPKFFPSGSRVILKNKNVKFKEVESGGKIKKPKEKIQYTEVEEEMISAVSEYLTENRLRNVISKIGEVTQKMFGKLLGAFVVDAMEDYQKDVDPPELEKDRQKLVNKAINKMAQEFIRERFLNIIDGVF